MGEGFSSACCGQLVKIIIILESYGIFGSYCAYLFILKLSECDEGWTNIILAGGGILVKMSITLEPKDIF